MMLSRTPSFLVLAPLFALSLSGCHSSGGFAQLQESLATSQQNQAAMLAKLEGLEAKVEAIPAPVAAKQKPAAAPAGRPNTALTYKVEVGDAAVKGSPDALVTIVEWSDFQCPFCSRVGPTIEQIQEKYGDQVRIAFKHNPLPMHNRAMAAAVAAEAAGRQGKFWEMHDKLFANGRALSDENIDAWAAELELDVEQFKNDQSDPALTKKIRAQQAQGAKLGARGTPSFFVNGRFVSGAQPLEAFSSLIDEELKKAEKLVAEGTPKSEVYARTIARGKAAV